MYTMTCVCVDTLLKCCHWVEVPSSYLNSEKAFAAAPMHHSSLCMVDTSCKNDISVSWLYTPCICRSCQGTVKMPRPFAKSANGGLVFRFMSMAGVHEMP